MRWKLRVGVLFVVALMGRGAFALDGEPVVGVEAGVAIPTSNFQRSADVGGALGVFGGYRLNLFENSLALSLLGEPMYAAFPTASCGAADERPCRPGGEGDVTGIFSLSGNARFSLVEDPVEVYFQAGGGYYNATSGAVSGGAGGFNIGGGILYTFERAMSAGVIVRRDQADIAAATNSTQDLQFITVGASFLYRFLPEPAVVAQAPPPPPPPPPAPVKQKLVLRGVNFDFDKADIRPDARPILDEAVATLKQHGNIKIAVDGYTDNIGSAAYNEKLSVRRAQSVAHYLSEGGIDASRMTVHGYGATNFVATNDTADGRAQNRRVELKILSGD